MKAFSVSNLELLSTRKASIGEVVKLSLPVIVSMGSLSVLGLVDTLFMGWIGPAAQAGVGLGSPIVFNLLAFFFGLWTGLSTFVSQLFGAGKHKKCGKYLWHVLYMAIVAGLFVSFVLTPFIPNILQFMGANPEILEPAAEYIQIRLYASPWVFLMFTCVSFLRGIGDMKTPAIIGIIAVFINIPFTYVLTFGFGPIPAYGVAGAAYGTVIAQVVECLLYFGTVLNSRNAQIFGTRNLVLPTLKIYKNYLRLSLPIAVFWALENVGWLMLGFYVATLSKFAVAAHAIVAQVSSLAFMPGLAMSIAVSTLVGQYLGAENPKSARQSARIGIRISVGIMCIMGILFFFLRHTVGGWFSSAPEVIEIASNLFIFAAVYQTFDALSITCAGALRGAGDTKVPMFIMILIMWCVMLPLTYILGNIVGWGVYGAWAAVAIALTFMGTSFYIRFIRGKWMSMRVKH